MNLLTDSIFTLSGKAAVSLPELFAAMVRGEVRGFPALRPHQRPAWHMFLVQLGALALWTARCDRLPKEPDDWAASLRGLTPAHADDAPWRLVVEERTKPAFLQPSDPGGLTWSTSATPDALDLLITSRNHDMKQAIARRASAEDWVFALVSLQTSEGYGGRGNYGIARMNGGSSSRAMLGLAPAKDGDTSIDPSGWWARDVRRLLATPRESAVGVPGGPALLWCLDWPEGRQLDLRDLDPWFIEICRRVRLTDTRDALSALHSSSKAARTDAKVFKGNVGDPWAPIHREGKSLTLGSGDFDYARLRELLFSGDWSVPLLARPGNNEAGDMLLVAEALSRGNSKTEGFKSRVVPVPGKIVPSFLSSESVATFSKAQMDEIKVFDAALRDAIALVAAGGNRDGIKRSHFKQSVQARKQFDRAADRLFFSNLWNRVAADASRDADAEAAAKTKFLRALMDAATAELNSALPAIPCPTIHRPRAETRARRAFYSRIRREHSILFQREEQANAAA